ncbi:DUF2306 domain-containing protein [Bacillus sp. FJAT-49736]|nr:DUF2306 domain-containing protein [Bacillus sp. FJAT-49736]
MKKIRIVTISIFAVLAAAYAIIQYGFYSPKLAGLVQYKLKSPNFHLTPWVYVLYMHIITACLALVIGPFQLFANKNGKRVRIHRLLGKVYVASIFISGMVNIYLSIFASGRWVASFGFFFLDLFWLYSTGMAVMWIIRGNVIQHKHWMWRSYSLTFAGVMLRIYLGPLLALFHGDFIHAYQILAWIAWVPNLFLIEYCIQRARIKSTKATTIH